MNTLERIAGELKAFAASVDVDTYAGVDAAKHAETCADITKITAALTILLAKRATSSGAWRSRSHAAAPEQWLANLMGPSEHRAKDALTLAGRLRECSLTDQELRAGNLSLEQASLVASAAHANPAKERHMVAVARRTSLTRLRAEENRIVADTLDADAEHARAKRNRHLRQWKRRFETGGSFSGPNDEIAELFAALEPRRRAAFEAARRAGRREGDAAYWYDALMQLVRDASGTSGDTKRTAPGVRVRVGLSRLLGHEPMPGEEMCEIPGVGPVPESVARDALPHGLFELVIGDGIDIRTVVSNSRYKPKALIIALQEGYGGTCRVRQCGRQRGIQDHHTLGFAETGRTQYDELSPYCPDHHDLMHHDGWIAIVADDGAHDLRPPAAEQRHSDAA